MRNSWLNRAFACLCVCVCAIHSNAAAWDDDDKYANPDGEDQYGPRYEAKTVPTEIREVLDDQGHYTVPSFIDLTIMDQNQECWVVGQNPQAGTVVSCPQTVTVHLTYTPDGTEQRTARLPIVLADVTPPSIDVIMDSNSATATGTPCPPDPCDP